jgi:RNA-directed DNA polymerase
MSLFENMLIELPFSADELVDLIATAQYRYKVYQIPKRQPNQFRTIAQPSPEVKLIQRWLMNNSLSALPIHKAATAYRCGKSIYDHAVLHANNRFLLKMDFKDFFPSISMLDVRRYLVEIGKMSAEDARLISMVVCWRDKSQGRLCLSIGAPSSPLISNLMMHSFDKKIVRICQERKIVYSRYADDLAFSTSKKDVLLDIPDLVKSICAEIEYPRLEINHKKTVSTSRAFKRVLVGLVLTPEGQVSLGRDKKRRLRSELYRFSHNSLEMGDIAKLRGELAFAWSVEKKFIFSLLRQFGKDTFIKLGLPFSLDFD